MLALIATSHLSFFYNEIFGGGGNDVYGYAVCDQLLDEIRTLISADKE